MIKGTALITGGSQRLGRAMALHCASHGYAVAVHCNRSVAQANAVVAEIEAAGGRACVVQADLASPDAVHGLVATASALGPVTCLINNASAFENDSIETLTSATWRQHLGINAEAPALLSQRMAAALPDSLDGLIVNMLDEAVTRPGPTFFSYTVSKAALAAMTEMLAQALAPRIRVNGIAPGLILDSGHSSQEAFERAHRNTLLGKGPGEDAIVRALDYLIHSDKVTGEILFVDAGKHLMQSQKYLPSKPLDPKP